MGLSVSPACVTWGGARPRGRLVLPRPLGRAPPHVTQAGLTLRSDVWLLLAFKVDPLYYKPASAV